MDRKQVKDTYPVASARIAEIVTTYGDEAYNLAFECKAQVSETGQLILFRLESTTGPTFLGRWDDADSRLDVDILGVSKAEMSRFKRGENGCAGHHSTAVPDRGRGFDVDVVYRGRRIFGGRIQINLDHLTRVRITAGCDVTATLTVTSEPI